jgi:phage gpG-like protein
LRNSISSDVESGPDGRIVGVGTNVAYGAFHEFGFRGVQNVKAHTRVISQVDRFGAEIDSRRVLRDRKKNVDRIQGHAQTGSEDEERVCVCAVCPGAQPASELQRAPFCAAGS